MENRVQRQAGRRTNRIVSPPIENPFYGRAWKLLDLLVGDLRHRPVPALVVSGVPWESGRPENSLGRP